MRLVFNELVITDFKALRGTHRIRLDLPGLTYLAGVNETNPGLVANGVSKSSIWDALVWCLYGKTPLGLRNEDVKPWSGGKTAVQVHLTVDGQKQVISRTTGPNRFTCNGEDLADFRTVGGLGFELAINTILLPQDKELFFDRKPGEKMLLFTETLALGRWDLRSKAASDAASGFDKEVLSLEQELATAQGGLDEVVRSLASARKAANEWSDRAKARTRVSTKAIAELEKQKAALQLKLDSANLAEDGALTELAACEVELRKLRGLFSRAGADIASMDARSRVLKQQLAQFEADLQALEVAKSCPTCGQLVKKKDLAEHKRRIERQIEETREFIQEAASERLVGARDRLEVKLAASEKAAEGFDAKARAAGDVLLRLRPEAEALGRQIMEARASQEAEENPYTQQLATLLARQKKLTRELGEIEEDLVASRSAAEHARYWVKGFRDVKLQQIEDVLAELEMTTNSMIEEVGLEGWEVKFDIEREAKSGNITSMLNVLISSPESGTKVVKWESYSGGEKQRLRLVGSLALVDTLLAHAGIETNLEVLDEPAVYWASESVQELVAVLAQRARDRSKSIFLIEHAAVESSHFARVWTVVKDARGVHITGEGRADEQRDQRTGAANRRR